MANRDVELFDGRGRRETLSWRNDEGAYEAPPGRFMELGGLDQDASGWMFLNADRTLSRFDRFGRLISIADSVRDSEDTGNELRFLYDLSSRLVQVVDSLDRAYDLSYDDDGRLTQLKDFSGRKVRYEYAPEGRLQRVISPPVTTGESKFPEGFFTRLDKP